MQAIAKGVVISIVVAIFILVFTNSVFFFPWYMTVVMETFNISQVAATNNYMPKSEYDDALDRMKGYQIFKERPEGISVEVMNESGYDAVGNDNPVDYDQEKQNDKSKPYRQRGKPITVKVSAVYPFKLVLWGVDINLNNNLKLDIPVSFSLTTIGLKHYKDWDYYD
jgi:hypothetical protein